VLAISYSLLGFVMSPSVVIFYSAMAGVAWGLFFTIYLVIPGDLSVCGSREIFYALGVVSPLIMMFIFELLGSFVSVRTSFYSQIISVLLFISIIPVLQAVETLKESKIRRRKLKEYTKRLGEIVKESKNSK
jgi:hypothetical protein